MNSGVLDKVVSQRNAVTDTTKYHDRRAFITVYILSNLLLFVPRRLCFMIFLLNIVSAFWLAEEPSSVIVLCLKNVRRRE